MAEMKEIHDFAVKWCDIFRDQNINYIELVATIKMVCRGTSQILQKRCLTSFVSMV